VFPVPPPCDLGLISDLIPAFFFDEDDRSHVLSNFASASGRSFVSITFGGRIFVRKDVFPIFRPQFLLPKFFH